MHQLAVADGMQLNEEHVQYIRKAREMYEQDGTVPAIRIFAKAVGIKNRKAKELYDLFETGPMKRCSHFDSDWPRTDNNHITSHVFLS